MADEQLDVVESKEEEAGEDDPEEEEKKRRGLFGRIGDFVEDRVDDIQDVVEDIKDGEFKKPVIINIKGIRNSGRRCHENARSTVELCGNTVTKAREMVEFGLEIKSTLTSMQGNMDASALATIKDLIDGDKMKSAMRLAGEMNGLALECVDKSTGMIDSMNEAIDKLPDIVERRIENKMEKAAEKGAREGDPELPDIQPDVDELDRCITAIREVNLVTVFDAGMNAFNGLTAKGDVCKEMFSAIKDFATSIVEVSQAIQDFELTKMIGKMRSLARDIWRCLRLGDLIKAFAERVGKLVKWIINLFKMANEKLSMIWGALAHAKDVMADVVHYVMEAMGLCDEAKQKSDQLIETSKEIKGHMRNMDNFNSSTIASLKDLADGSEIRLMIDLATSMDDIVLEAVKKVIAMVKKVTEAFTNLPDVITEGISDMMEAGKADNDPDPVDVEQDVRDLESQKTDIENAGALQTIQASRTGFGNAEDKISKTREMIQQSRGFAASCNDNIEDFMGSWDIQKAMGKLIEMCRLVKLGEMLQQFAEQIRRLVKAVVAVLQSLRNKFKNMDLVPDQLEDVVEEAVDAASKYCGCVMQ